MTHGPYLERFGDYVLPTNETETPISLGPVDFTPFPLVGGGALNPFGSTGRAVRKGGDLPYNVIFSGRTPEELQAKLDECMSHMGTQEKLYKLMPDDTHRWVHAAMLDTSGTITPLDQLHARVTLSWSCLSAYWYASSAEYDMSQDFYDEDEGDLLTTLVAGLPVGSLVTLSPLHNHGNVPQADVSITVTAVGGTMTSVTITSTTTGHSFVWTGSLAAGKALVIDTGAWSIEADGVDAYDNFTPPTDKADWMVLDPGDNIWTIVITGSDATVEIEWFDAWE